MSLSNITFTCNNKRVTIATTGPAYTFMNNLIPPISTPTTETTKPGPVKVVNLLRWTEEFTIIGHIITGLGTNAGTPVERTNAKDVKYDLIEMAKFRTVTVMSYEGQSYNVTFKTLTIKDVLMEGEEASDGVIRYDVTINVVSGDAMF